MRNQKLTRCGLIFPHQSLGLESELEPSEKADREAYVSLIRTAFVPAEVSGHTRLSICLSVSQLALCLSASRFPMGWGAGITPPFSKTFPPHPKYFFATQQFIDS